MMTNVLDLRSTSDPRDLIYASVQTLVEDGVVGVPTDTVYGLAASALSETAVDRLFDIKGREEHVPLAISVPSRETMVDFCGELSALARRLSLRCWPGPLTIVIPCDHPDSAATRLPPPVQERILGEGKCIGFRVVDHRVISQIHRFLAAPLLLTSANLSGKTACTTAQGVVEQLDGRIPLLLDDGPTRYGGASTVVRVQNNHMEILREGMIERAAMDQFAKPVIALVCTGNTCRSPMAETLMREQLRSKLGAEDAVRVLSAGVAAAPGMGASPQAIEVMGKRNLDLTGHASQPLDESIVNVADLILTMTRGHQAAILAAFPNMQDRVFTLRRDGGDISDPVGMPVEVYQSCAKQIEEEISAWLDTLDDDFFPEPTVS